jgi:hypothetical protein
MLEGAGRMKGNPLAATVAGLAEQLVQTALLGSQHFASIAGDRDIRAAFSA